MPQLHLAAAAGKRAFFASAGGCLFIRSTHLLLDLLIATCSGCC